MTPPTTKYTSCSMQITKVVSGEEMQIAEISILDNDLSGVQLRNVAGRFVSAQVSGFREAVMQSAWNRKGDFTAPLVNLPGAETWPITMGTFIVVPAVSASGPRTLAALKFLTWGYFHGDELAARARRC